MWPPKQCKFRVSHAPLQSCPAGSQVLQDDQRNTESSRTQAWILVGATLHQTAAQPPPEFGQLCLRISESLRNCLAAKQHRSALHVQAASICWSRPAPMRDQRLPHEEV